VITVNQLEKALLRFGHSSFRPLQLETIQAVLEGRDALTVLPTGGGKSLTYQLPATLLPGTTVVVSPLIALMKDQVDALERRGVRATYLASNLSSEEFNSRLEGVRRGDYKLVYIAPERVRVSASMLAKAALVVVDEAHCVSQWGHDFRPDYLAVGDILRPLNAPTLALTATATPKVREEIAERLLNNPLVQVGSFDRPNLTFSVHDTPTEGMKLETLRLLRRQHPGPCIVYCSTRKKTEELADALGGVAYHAGLPDATRSKVQDRFLAGKADLICATVAFGMGIDKSDVRLVVHYQHPGTLEAYYQEAGRAGRDGHHAHAAMLYAVQDTMTRKRLIEGNYPPDRLIWSVFDSLKGEPGASSDVSERLGFDSTPVNVAVKALYDANLLTLKGGVYTAVKGANARTASYTAMYTRKRFELNAMEKVVGYARTAGCRRAFLVGHFGDRMNPCGNCDRCRPELGEVGDSRKSASLRTGIVSLAKRKTITKKLMVQVLTGSTAKEVVMSGLRTDPGFGVLRFYSQDEVRAAVDEAIKDGEIQEKSGVIVISGSSPAQEDRPTHESRASKNTVLARKTAPSCSQDSTYRAVRADGLLALPDGAPQNAKPELDLADPLTMALKAWRLEAAKRDKLSPAYVMHDKTLAALVTARPRTLEALGNVPGIGPSKLERYGKDMLEVLAGDMGTRPASPNPIPRVEKSKLETPKVVAQEHRPAPEKPSSGFAFTEALELIEAATQGVRFEASLLEEQLSKLPERVLSKALEIIAELGGRFEAVRPYLDHADEQITASAITALAKLDPEFEMEFMLEDARPRVRLAAVRVSKDRATLENISSRDPVNYVRTAARVRLWALES
jgi:ATP-dependent DNA helicase RecQ